MDLNKIRQVATTAFKKYKYVVLVLSIGIGAMLIPDMIDRSPEKEVVIEHGERADPTDQLCHILSQIKGAGKVQVLLTLESGERTVYQTDGDSGAGDTVIINDADRTQQGLVQQVMSARYRGAVVVCQGADEPSVRLAIVEAVSNTTGLSTDRISVLKMK